MTTNSDSDFAPIQEASPLVQHLINGSYSTLLNARAKYLELGGREPVAIISVTDIKVEPITVICKELPAVGGSIDCGECSDPECICGRCNFTIFTVQGAIEVLKRNGTDPMVEASCEWLQSVQKNDVLPVLVREKKGKKMSGLVLPLPTTEKPDSDQADKG